MPPLHQIAASELETPPRGTPLLEKLPASIKGIIAMAALGVASGCSTSSQYRTNPTDANLNIVSNGNLYYAPPRELGHGESPRVDGSVSRSVAGAGIGYVVCRVL